MDMMLTVSFSLKIPKDEFFYAESGRVKDEMKEQMEKLFPREIMLPGGIAAKREHLIHAPLIENKNCLRCASCGRWLYMPGKEDMSASLDYCKMVKEIPLCASCAWELEKDLENEEFVQKLKAVHTREL